MKKIILILTLITLIIFSPKVYAQEKICGVYFTGVGCPHCAKTDPVVLEDLLEENPNLFLIEYEIYQQSENAYLLYAYNEKYKSTLGIPLIIFSHEQKIGGDAPILNNIKKIIESLSGGNPCPLYDGTLKNIEEIDINSLPGKPKIWQKNKIIIKSGKIDNELAKEILKSKNLSETMKSKDYEVITPEPVPLSGKNVLFENAIKLSGMIYQWNGPPLEEKVSDINDTSENQHEQKNELTLTKIISLAAVDAVNPCAIAVLTLMLIAILTYNPEKKKNVLLAGFAFTSSVFVMYLFYGLVIIKFFHIVQALTATRLLLYKILGIIAIVLGMLNMKDFFMYKPGGIGTEMPMRMRSKVKKIIEGIVNPRGAFLVGIFVTIFLLPCTIGPYIIAGGILSVFEIIKTVPWLLLYNFIFILPMLAITFIIYGGIAEVEDVSGWKEKNIRYLHLIAGIIMMLLGIAMFIGWV